MKKKLVFLILIFLILVVHNVNGYASGSVSVRYVGPSNMGYYEVVMHYHNESDFQMGQLYGKALISQYPTLEEGYANYLSDSLNQPDYDKMMDRVQKIKNQIPKEYLDFIYGLASQFNGGNVNDKNDGLLSIDEIIYFNISSEIHRPTQCSAVAVYGSASDTGKPIIGRLLDWPSGFRGVIYYIYKGSKKIIIIGTSLLSQAVSTGLNHHGIFAATLDSPTGKPFPDLGKDTYYSYRFDLRYALENYRTIEDVAAYLSQKKYTFNHIILLGDPKTVKVLENDLERNRALRDADSELNDGITWEFPDAIGAVNAFMLKGNNDNFTINPNNTFRWESIKYQLNTYLSSVNKITVDEMKLITTYYGTNIYSFSDGGIMNHITQQIVIFDYKNHDLHVFFRNRREIGDENNETTFDIDHPEFLVIPLKSKLSKIGKTY